MRLRDLQGPVAASAFAGLLGAGVADAALTLARAGGSASALALAALGVGLYGAAGIVAALLLGALSGAVRGAMPGGWSGLRNHPDRDRAAAAGVLAGVLGALVVAVGAALGQRLFVGKMASPKLAAIAAAGMVLLGAPPAAAIALGARAPLDAWSRDGCRARREWPRPAWCCWRCWAAAAGRGWRAVARRLAGAGPGTARRAGLAGVLGRRALAVLALSVRGRAAGRGGSRSLPIKVGAVVLVALSLAVGGAHTRVVDQLQGGDRRIAGAALRRHAGARLTDHDGDGFSARFGGGDCDDTPPDVYPGADDIPGDGIDQNCEGGDARGARRADRARGAPRRPRRAAGRGARRSRPGRSRPGAPLKGNILIVTIDAFRADRLGVAGYGRPPGRSLTPTLDALARAGPTSGASGRRRPTRRARSRRS